MTNLDAHYWNTRYLNQETGWDIGEASGPLIHLIDQLQGRQLRILIPGCGQAYEAEYLWMKGFRDITLLDFAPEAVERIRHRLGEKEGIKVIQADFFQHEGSYDLVLEQTFFCALPRELRPDYVRHMHRLLTPQGRLQGVLFGVEFEKEGPPFGGSSEEYQALFTPYFQLLKLELCTHSIPPRAGNEIWFDARPLSEAASG